MRNNQPVSSREFLYPPEHPLVSVTDVKGRIVHCNPAFVAVSGYARDELMGQPHNLVRHPDMPEEVFRDMWATIANGRPWQGIVKNRRKNGDHYWALANATPMRDGSRTVGYLSVRTAPTRAQVQAADALYASMRAQAARGRAHLGLRAGRVTRLDPVGRALDLAGAQIRRWGWDGAVGLLAVGCTGLAASLLPIAAWTPLAVLLAALAWAVSWWRREGKLEALLGDALELAAGNLAHQPGTGEPDRLGTLQLALSQTAVNLRTVVADLRSEVDGVRVAVGEISAGNKDLSARTEAQASSLEQTAASMEQITGTIKQSAASAAQGSSLAGETAVVAKRSQAGVLDVVQAMAGISESSRRIGEIIHVVEGVAFQTNILALNAAVEAARAGEAGRGFAVVAAEVRTLASRTTEAAREIRQLVAEASERVETGNQQTDAARERMSEALQSVARVGHLLQEISSAAQEQQLGVVQVNEAVAHMDAITQQNAAMVEQLAASAQSLGGQMDQVSSGLRMFRLRPGDKTVAEQDAVALRHSLKHRGELTTAATGV